MLDQDMASANGYNQSRTEYVWNDHDLYVICQADDGGETERVIRLRRSVEFAIASDPTISARIGETTTITVNSNRAAACRRDWSDGNSYPYGALYQPLASQDGYRHQFDYRP